MPEPIAPQPAPVKATPKPIPAGKQKPVAQLTDWDALDAVLAEDTVGGKSRIIDQAELEAKLREDVRGQDEAIKLVASRVSNGYLKENRTKPVASLLLVGSPGSGKTETAKSLAKALFGEDSLLKIDCSEYEGPDAMHRLIGMGAGYQNSDKGGTLTTKMLASGTKVVLFDEIEKGNRSIDKLFLTMLNDGYITNGMGQKVDFTRAVVIVTSNIEHEKCAEINKTVKNYVERGLAFKELFKPHGFLPEILNRFADVLYYGPLPPRVMAEIIAGKLSKVVAEYAMTCDFIDVPAIIAILSQVTKNAGNVRDMEGLITELLGESIANCKRAKAKGVRIVKTDEGSLAAVAA